MFERAHHQLIAQFLCTLDGARLRELACLFGGGTAITLLCGEYRESVDVDFLVSDAAAYRSLRQQVRERDNLAPLLRTGAPPLEVIRGIRTDQYGIRARINVAGTPVKFEIVREARITLDPPDGNDEICGVTTLSRADLVASKLLANSDRGRDDSTFNRDALDLAMLAPGTAALKRGLAKAEVAYGSDIRRDWNLSVKRLRERAGWLDECMQRLAMAPPRATLWARLRKLARDLERIAPA